MFRIVYNFDNYNSLKFKKYSISIETFSKKRKNLSKVYHTGIRNYQTDHFKAYTIVLHTLRLSLLKDKVQQGCCS